MKTKLLFWAGTLLISVHAYSQVGINTPTPSSTLDVRGSVEGNFREITTTDALNATDYHVSFSGTSNSVLNLPSKSATDGTSADFTGRKYYIKNNSVSNTLTLTAASGQAMRLGSNNADSNTYVVKPGKLAVLTANGANGWDLSTDVYWSILDVAANGPKVAAQVVPAGTAYYTVTDSPVTVNVPVAGTKVVLYFAGMGTSTGASNSLGTLRFQIGQTGTALATYPSVAMISWYHINGANPVSFNFKTAYSVSNLAPGTYTFSLQARREGEAGSITDVTIWSSGGTAKVFYK
ncbi:hypothetical protein N6B72_01315 [Chryseobacterium soli]|uniref:hypothetical protein n=1 Tax=Chryseobacterium soli TaxID=445961 RepID=UPI0029556F7C|nr:hypothetical protein [Chryseobacterium soli]MDV7695546.1 hypothetical protein [Chryseobacterium soli]